MESFAGASVKSIVSSLGVRREGGLGEYPERDESRRQTRSIAQDQRVKGRYSELEASSR